MHKEIDERIKKLNAQRNSKKDSKKIQKRNEFYFFVQRKEKKKNKAILEDLHLEKLKIT
jgi:hypothetical protein